jgi:hypothetical protein
MREVTPRGLRKKNSSVEREKKKEKKTKTIVWKFGLRYERFIT